MLSHSFPVFTLRLQWQRTLIRGWGIVRGRRSVDLSFARLLGFAAVFVT